MPTLLAKLRKPLQRIIYAAAVCALLVAVSVRYVDRPVANWVHQNLGDARFDWFTAYYDGHLLVIGPFSLMAGPAQALGPFAVFMLAMLAGAAAIGRRPKMRGRIILALTLSVFAAMEINAVAKWAFGRTWPESWLGTNPSWIRDGVYGFFPFHGGSGWGSFPSGHTTIITTPAVIMWIVWPKLRPLWAAIVALVIVGLVGANYHFVSDIIGGLFLGTAIGLSLTALMLSPNDHLNWWILRHSAPAETFPPAAEPENASRADLENSRH